MVTRLMFTRIVLGLALSVVVPATLAATTPVGATPGSFAVNQNGGATYTIPITAPPGTAGMAPKLALTYDKQVQNDLLGVGWSVSGLSLIQRCGATIALDGFKGGVNYDNNDRFCLDGQRLIAINNGVYGANGTEYRTEKEGFSKIISYGNSAQYFRVTSKSGTVMEYGVTTDSRIEAQGKGTVRVWALNKIQDTKGNYFTISYFKDTGATGTGEYRPTRIDYTGSAAALLASYNSVQFAYGPRTDITPRYEGGSVIKTTQRLTDVKTCTAVTSTQLCTDPGVSLVRDYQLAYDNNGAVGGSRLLSVTECGSDGVCLPGTRAGWSQKADGTFAAQSTVFPNGWNFGIPTQFQLITGDFNGDGKTDYIEMGGTTQYVFLSNGDGTFTAQSTVFPNGWNFGIPTQFQLITGDFNGDGKTDYIEMGGTTQYVFLSNGDGTFTAQSTVFPNGWNFGIPTYFQLITGDFNSDGKTDYIEMGGTTQYVFLSNGVLSDTLLSITNGLGAQTAITYKPLTDSTVYTKDSGAAYPYQDIQNATYVVSSYSMSDGIGGSINHSYTYAGAKNHVTRNEWLGFRHLETLNNSSGVKSITEYNQIVDGTQNILNFSATVIAATNRTVNSLQNFWSASAFTTGLQKFAHLDGVVEQSLQLDGNTLSRINTSYTRDAFGNATTVIVDFNDGTSKTTTNTVTNDTTNWLLGLISQTSTTHTIPPNQVSAARVTAFSYDASGLLTSTTVEPGGNLSTTTSYTYDAFGNKLTTSVSGTGVVSRTAGNTYDSRGQFLTSSANALNQTETYAFDPRWGVLASQTGPNGLTTTWSYDGFGRKLLETRPDTNTTTISYAATAPGYSVTTQVSGSPAVMAYFDLLGRATRGQTQGFDGTTIYQDTQYNNLGLIAQVSTPYLPAITLPANAPRTMYTYDILGRVTRVIAPDGSATSTNYAGRGPTLLGAIVQVTNALNQTTSQTVNGEGQTIAVKDALNNTTVYTYDAFGNLIQTTDPQGHAITLSYDLRGRKTGMNDPDMGTWSYTYDAFGELLSQTDAKGQTVSMTYDPLGRLQTRSELEGVSQWSYDSAVKGIGKPALVSGANGYQQTFAYDTLGRPASLQATVEGEVYTTTTSYDSLSRVSNRTYPMTGVSINNVYNAQGFLSEVHDAASNALYWRTDSVNVRGQITHETLGNNLASTHGYDPLTGLLQTMTTGTGSNSTVVQNLSYSFDALGNLLNRHDTNQNTTESFTYDALNRLTAATGLSSKTYGYDSLGNLTSKSDVGTYTYGTTTLPHALLSTSGTLNASYTYDADGNMLSGNGRGFSYTSFNKPSQISQMGAITTLAYDANHNRLTKTTASGKTVYIGGAYERLTAGTLITHKHFIMAAGGPIAIVTKRSDNTSDVRYLHKDHLGSIDTITDETGTVVERLSFDPHGKRRQSNWLDATTAVASLTTKGFTGHEMDDEQGLINMKAREYDPVLGRFITPDTLIPGATNQQAFNRYSYVHNNPLSFTDPSGHWPHWHTHIHFNLGHAISHAFQQSVHASLHAEMVISGLDRVDHYLVQHPRLILIVDTVGTIAASFVGLGPEFHAAFDAQLSYYKNGSLNDAARAGVK